MLVSGNGAAERALCLKEALFLFVSIMLMYCTKENRNYTDSKNFKPKPKRLTSTYMQSHLMKEMDCAYKIERRTYTLYINFEHKNN